MRHGIDGVIRRKDKDPLQRGEVVLVLWRTAAAALFTTCMRIKHVLRTGTGGKVVPWLEER